VLQNAVPTQDVTKQETFLFFIVCGIFLSSLTLYNTSLFFPRGLSDLRPSPAPHLKTFRVFLIHSSKSVVVILTQLLII